MFVYHVYPTAFNVQILTHAMNAMSPLMFGTQNRNNVRVSAKLENIMILSCKVVGNVKFNIALFVMAREGNVMSAG